MDRKTGTMVRVENRMIGSEDPEYMFSKEEVMNGQVSRCHVRERSSRRRDREDPRDES